MIIDIRQIRPRIYEISEFFSEDEMVDTKSIPELNYGWVDIEEISMITKINPRELLFQFWNLNFRKFRFFGEKKRAFLLSEMKPKPKYYYLVRHKYEDLFKKMCSSGHDLAGSVLNPLVNNGRVLVPAG